MTAAPDTTATPSTQGNRHALTTLLVGEGISYTGTAVHTVALPALAVLHLHASPGDIALLAFAAQVPALVVALPAGVVLDRYPIRTVRITTDVAAAAVVLAIPTAALLGQLTMPALYAVALALGTLNVFHRASAMAALPRLAGAGALHQAHARLTAAITIAGAAGTSLGTVLVSAVGPARAIVADALSFCASAWCATRLRPLPVADSADGRPSMAGAIRGGLLHSARDPLLRPLLLTLAATGVGTGLTSTYLAYYLLTTVQTGTTGLGLILAAGSLGGLSGALLAPRLAQRYGPGTVLGAGLTVYALTQAAPLIAGTGPGWLAALAIAGFTQNAAATGVGTTQRAMQQSVSPPHLRPRIQQTAIWLFSGSQTLASLAAGALAALTSVPTTMLTGLMFLSLAAWALWHSPVGRLTAMPTAIDT